MEEQTTAKERPAQKTASSPESKRILHNPVDRGWSWVVLACMCLIQVNCIGLLKSFGVLFVPIQRQFGSPAYMVSLIIGTQAGVFGLTAVVALSIMMKLLSVRVIVMVGGITLMLGQVSGFFLDSVVLFIIVYGVLLGIGFALCFGPSLVLLGVYFEKRRAVAAAVANTGGGVGALLVPYLTQVMLDEYGFRGAFFLMAGLYAQNIVLACFFTPPTDYKPGGGGSSGEGGAKEPLLETPASALSTVPEECAQNPTSTHVKDSRDPFSNRDKDAWSPIYKPRREELLFEEFRPRTYSDGYSRTSSGKGRRFARPEENELHLEVLRNSERELDDNFNTKRNVEFRMRKQHRAISTSSEIVGPGFLGALSASLPILNHGVGHKPSSPASSQATEDDFDNEYDDDNDVKRGTQRTGCQKACGRFSDASLYKSPMVWLIFLYNFFGVLGVNVPGSFVPPLAVEKGLTPADGTLLLVIAGSLDIVSRLVPGIIVQMKWMKPQRMVCIAFIVLGSVFQFCSYFNTWAALVFLVVAYGLLAGMFISTLQLIIIDLVGLERFPRAFGVSQLAIAASCAVAYPLIGFLRDVSGTYTTSFNMMGACLLLSAIFLLLEPLARRLEARTVQRQNQRV